MRSDDGAQGARPPTAGDTEGIEKRDPRTVEREVDARRVKRRLKAAASLVLAAAAGTFLACVGKRDKNRPTPAPNPTTHESSNLPAPQGQADAGVARPDAGRQAGNPQGPPDARPDARHPDRPTVDRAEHRKGMPVRDNLLE